MDMSRARKLNILEYGVWREVLVLSFRVGASVR